MRVFRSIIAMVVLGLAIFLAGCGGGGGGTNTTSAPITPTQQAATWWPPANLAPIGTKLFGINTLSSSALKIGDSSWQTATKDGTIKFVRTGAVPTGFSGRSIMFAGYAWNNLYCTTPVFEDDGSALDPTSVQYSSPVAVCHPEAYDMLVGTADGVVRRVPSLGQCFKQTWAGSALTPINFSDTAVPCPS